MPQPQPREQGTVPKGLYSVRDRQRVSANNPVPDSREGRAMARGGMPPRPGCSLLYSLRWGGEWELQRFGTLVDGRGRLLMLQSGR